MRKLLLILALMLSLSGALLATEDEIRFPPPEFESGYVFPEQVHAAPRCLMAEYRDLALLAVALIAATWLALKKRSRRGLQFLALMCLVYFGFLREGCTCSIGSIQNVAHALTNSGYTVPITVLGFCLLPLLFALFFGRVFCSGVCPLGAIQELILVKPQKLPKWLAEALGVVPYAYLGVSLLVASISGVALICRYDPFISLFRLTGTYNQSVFAASFIVIVMVVPRAYCRFLCPYGVLMKLASRLSKWHLTITPDKCIKCKLCEDSCPYRAIVVPTPPGPMPEIKREKRILALLIFLTPVLAVAFGIFGSKASRYLANQDMTVKKARAVYWFNDSRGAAFPTTEMTLLNESFTMEGGNRLDLYLEADLIKEKYRYYGGIVGALLGLIIGLKLIRLTKYRREHDYVPERGNCVSCGRCVEYCPQERVRRGGIGGNDDLQV